MDGGKSKTRAPSQAHRGRRRFRAAATPWFVAALAATLVGSGRVPDQAVLADGPGPSNTVDSLTAEQPVTAPPEFQIPGTRAVQAPASVSAPDSTAGGVAAAGIPDPALAAYQRAAVVIDTADLTCHLDWPLLAGIGQVESDHGQVGGSVLDSDGVGHPSILGPRLDGQHGTSLVRDTDAGRLDGDRRSTGRSGPCSSCRRPGPWSRSTATTTAPATSRTSTTPPSGPRSTCAPATATSRPRPGPRRPCSATTTARPTSRR